MKNRLIATVAAAFVAASSANAQIGHEPARSPYHDLERAHELTYLSGFYRARVDAARVAPRSGLMTGIRYQWHAGGPANLTAEVSRVSSERRVLDPDRPNTCATGPVEDCKLIDMYRWPLYFADLGVSLNLTGNRSFRRLVPEVRGGLGIVSDFHTRADVGDFAFGTKFALSFGTAIRWVPGGRYQVRLDFANRVYTMKYPASYFALAPDSSSIRPLGTKPSVWLNNGAFLIGVSYLFGR